MESDPIGLYGGLNTYLYAEANPVIFIDPFGLYSGVANNYNPEAVAQRVQQNIQDAYNRARRAIDEATRPTYNVPDPNKVCVTAECAAGLPPAKSENRTEKELDCDLCQFTCAISTVFLPGPMLPTSKEELAPFAASQGGAYLMCKAVCAEKCEDCAE